MKQTNCRVMCLPKSFPCVQACKGGGGLHTYMAQMIPNALTIIQLDSGI